MRPMADADVPAVLRIEATWRGPRRADDFRALLTDPRAWCQVAVGPQGVLGYLIAHDADVEVELHDVAVDPAARRSGAGRALVTALLTWAGTRGVAQVFLEVRQGNEPAQGLYRSLGFEAVGRRRRYYSDGEDALVFSATPSSSGAPGSTSSGGAAGGTVDGA
ncbi:MAG: ribosomal protein S18-alanine N-acetyltransferase [Myxococcales bacterium]|nr:ribosomal protein S18-alanine N-acetyltransferase [Myxococcales bacterium]MCB9526474.1 ribosomal protein S18-alanine N-acetyltransferase [Myxococcales bacterium]